MLISKLHKMRTELTFCCWHKCFWLRLFHVSLYLASCTYIKHFVSPLERFHIYLGWFLAVFCIHAIHVVCVYRYANKYLWFTADSSNLTFVVYGEHATMFVYVCQTYIKIYPLKLKWDRVVLWRPSLSVRKSVYLFRYWQFVFWK